MDAQRADTVTLGLVVAEIAELDSCQSSSNGLLRPRILQSGQPLRKFGGDTDFKLHWSSYRLRKLLSNIIDIPAKIKAAG